MPMIRYIRVYDINYSVEVFNMLIIMWYKNRYYLKDYPHLIPSREIYLSRRKTIGLRFMSLRYIYIFFSCQHFAQQDIYRIHHMICTAFLNPPF